jgi:beta-glucanase (GH16 family)
MTEMKTKQLISFGPMILASVMSLSLWSCSSTNEVEQHNWKLVWQDEFNTPGAPDATKWSYDIGVGPDNNGWGNSESETYTNSSDNVVVADGSLQITARKNGNAFTSARINTKGLFEQAYGRFEARIKLPYGPGIWPAFWMLGNDQDTAGWPLCGEIDIMEGKGQEPNIVHGTVHGPGYSGGNAITQSFGMENARFDTDYHIYAVEWTANCIDFYVDNTLYKRITPNDVTGQWVYNHPFYVLLNVAVGGSYAGYPNDLTPFPQTMYVDYVRVYKEQ